MAKRRPGFSQWRRRYFYFRVQYSITVVFGQGVPDGWPAATVVAA
jgi:hypothetical protein